MASVSSFPMTSTSESQPRSTSAVKRAAVITHGKPGTIGPALDRLERLARTAGVELLLPDDEVAKHGGEAESDLGAADIAVVLGGDGTMLRALQRFMGTDVPVIGVNFGRVGFLATIPRDELEIRNETLDVGVTVIVDGHELTDVGHGARIVVRLGDRDALLATLPEATFFRRYSETFSQ